MAGKWVCDFMGGVSRVYYRDGVFQAYIGGMVLLELVRWLFGIAIIFVATESALSMDRQSGLFSAVRYESRSRWWRRHFLFCFLTGAAAAVCYWMILHALDLVLKQPVDFFASEYLIAILWLGHMLTLVALLCLLDATRLSGMAPVILLATEVFTIGLSFSFWAFAKFMFGTWGMYVESRHLDPVNGFSDIPVLLIEGGIIALSYIGGLQWIRRTDWNYSGKI